MHAAVVQAAVKERMAERIPGSFTAAEYAAELGIGDATARRQVSKLVSLGMLKRVLVPVETAPGVYSKRAGYIEVKK